MTKSKILNIPIYKVSIKVTITDNIYKYALKNNYTNPSKKEKKSYSIIKACIFNLLEENKYDYSFEAIFKQDKYAEYIIVHETFHICKAILENKGCTLSDSSEEAWAYLMEFIYMKLRITLIELKMI